MSRSTITVTMGSTAIVMSMCIVKSIAIATNTVTITGMAIVTNTVTDTLTARRVGRRW
jgi:hypothetical protein